MARKTAITIGTTFSSQYADSSSVFTVVGDRGKDTYDCEIKAHPQQGTDIDWLGHKKVFGGEEIRHLLATEKLWDNLAKASDDFWASVKVGEIIHYHNGFGQYVRGVIVKTQRGMEMRPIALVGNWTHELPRRKLDGTVNYSYYVKRIRFSDESSICRPSDSCVWEADGFSKPYGPMRDFDPTTADPIDLSDPAPLEGEAAVFATFEKLRMDIGHILSDGYRDPKASLEETVKMLRAANLV